MAASSSNLRIPNVHGSSHSYASSLPSSTVLIAQASIERDIAADEGDDTDDDEYEDPFSHGLDIDVTLHPSTSLPNRNGYDHFMAGTYRRPSFTAPPGRGTIVPTFGKADERLQLTAQEQEEGVAEERSLLRDCNFILPKHPRKPATNNDVLSQQIQEDKQTKNNREQRLREPDENTALLGNPDLPYGGQNSPETISKKWEEAVLAGRIHTTWQREAKTIGRYSAPLIVTFVLQYSLTVASIFTLGHLGSVELGAVSLASMTANITGYAIFQGLATSLDTLCAQAYGSGKRHLVGLQMQRMCLFLLTITIPIGIVWLCSPYILKLMVPEERTAELAGTYLRILLLGAPGFAAFESGKRFVQAQGLFSACLYVLLFCAPVNALMNYTFVWRLGFGFVGAPIAVAITDNLLPLGLFLYVRFVAGSECWNGFSRRAWSNWGPMCRLALPGVIMVEAEVLAFEILTLVSSYFGTTALAAQAVLSTLTSLTWQLPFPVSIAASTRIANLIGATLAQPAKVTARVALCVSVVIGFLNSSLLFFLRDSIPHLFTNDDAVASLVTQLLPVCAAFQLFDALAACCNGILRGLGWQSVGGWVQLACYYVWAMPISLGLGLGCNWGLEGLWTGVATALGLVFSIELCVLTRTNWETSVEEARKRNALA